MHNLPEEKKSHRKTVKNITETELKSTINIKSYSLIIILTNTNALVIKYMYVFPPYKTGSSYHTHWNIKKRQNTISI